MAERIDLTVKTLCSGSAEEWAFFCILLRSDSGPYETPNILAFLYRVLLSFAAYAG
jgi:hypothetical protein